MGGGGSLSGHVDDRRLSPARPGTAGLALMRRSDGSRAGLVTIMPDFGVWLRGRAESVFFSGIIHGAFV